MRERLVGREPAFDFFVVQPQRAADGDRANGILRVVRPLQRRPARLIGGIDILGETR